MISFGSKKVVTDISVKTSFGVVEGHAATVASYSDVFDVVITRPQGLTEAQQEAASNLLRAKAEECAAIHKARTTYAEAVSYVEKQLGLKEAEEAEKAELP
jgi:hypothetical protein